ncbi:hypothetical protein AKJ65_07545 [candidate division MSBL1 archaeon SCGC-AAA259E19]|uniref:FIST domain-containing protein n=1 Tax=candidate division MSBL1 archaeon SCGC-AAA259E19 TaxID=1698264 RepID=A0A133UE20_9EURY|nr:hypothetical protein AKJ65_07545 [candidate division MSBL1 archaeon SCGC-AAA259E19]
MDFFTAYSTLKKGNEALEECIREIPVSIDELDLIMIFTTESYNQELIQETAANSLNKTEFIGLCVPGLITPEGVIREGVELVAIGGERVEAKTIVRKIENESGRTGQKIGEKILSHGFQKGNVMLFPTTDLEESSSLIKGLYNKLGPEFKFLGGRVSKIFGQEDLGNGRVAVAVLTGPKVLTRVGHGWKTESEPLVITSSEALSIKSIDGKSAYQRYAEALGGIKEEEFSEYHLLHPIGIPDIYGNYLIREVLSVNDDGSLNVVSEVPEGVVVNVMKANIKDLIENTEKMVDSIANDVSNPQFVLLFDCISREDLLAENGKGGKEIKIVKEKFGTELPICGALTFGEIGSFTKTPKLHNKTMCLGVGSPSRGEKN